MKLKIKNEKGYLRSAWLLSSLIEMFPYDFDEMGYKGSEKDKIFYPEIFDKNVKRELYENRKRRKKMALRSPEFFRNYPKSWFPKEWEKYEREQKKLGKEGDN